MLSHDLIQATAPTGKEAAEKMVKLYSAWEEKHPNSRITDFTGIRADGGDCVVASLLVSYIEFRTHTDTHI